MKDLVSCTSALCMMSAWSQGCFLSWSQQHTSYCVMSTMKKNNLHQLLLFPLPNSQIRKFHFSGLFREMFWSPMLSSSHSCRGEGWKEEAGKMSRGEGKSKYPLHSAHSLCIVTASTVVNEWKYSPNKDYFWNKFSSSSATSTCPSRAGGMLDWMAPLPHCHRPTCLLHDPLLLSLLVRRTYLEFHLFQILTLF